MYAQDVIIDRMVTGESFWYKITASSRRQSGSLSFRLRVPYRTLSHLMKDLPEAEVKRNGDYVYRVPQGHPLYRTIDEIFTSINKGDSYCDSKTSKVVHIKEDN